MRMMTFPQVFRQATGEDLVPGTLNVKVDRMVRVKEDFRIRGLDIGEPDQDLVFERCLINGIPSYRIRPVNLRHGGGGHGDDIIEVSSPRRIEPNRVGTIVEVTFFRDAL